MIPQILDLIVCPECSAGSVRYDAFEDDSRGRITEGVVWCTACRYWYPIAGGVLELLPDRLAYHEDRKAFWTRHARTLRAVDLDYAAPRCSRDPASPEARQQHHFDWYAANESQTYNAYERTPFWQAVDTMIFDEWRNTIAEGSLLLDVGCAQGRSSARLVDRDLTLVGFDVSRALVRQAHERYARRDRGARAVFFAADASRFPLKDATFDYVLLYGVLHHLDDPIRGCAEIARVLRPGGTYFGAENNRTILRPVFDLLQRLWPLWHEEAGTRPTMSAAELVDWLGRAGLCAAARSIVFLPPHLANRMSLSGAGRVMRAVETLMRRVPVVRDHGGLLVASGTKPLHPADA